MKNLFIKTICLLSLIGYEVSAQSSDNTSTQKFGNTLNIGVGNGYYGFGFFNPGVMLNYEFDVAKNFTLAPFIGYSTFQDQYYWGNPNKPNYDPSYHYYNYRETIVPVGAKATYYFDQLLNINPKWDLYLGASVGYAFRSVTWDNGYYGDTRAYRDVNSLYLALHIGAEYHINQKAGLFLDLSSGISTFGLAIHFNK